MDAGSLSETARSAGEQAFIDRAHDLGLDIEELWLKALTVEDDDAFDQFMDCSNAAFAAAECDMRSSAHVVIHLT